MERIIIKAAVESPKGPRSQKYTGIPMARPMLKQISCRFVRLNMTLVLTLVKSFGTGTYGINSSFNGR